jgi:phosphoglycerate kinase
MNLKSIAEVSPEQLKGKKVLVRVDFNVPIENGKVTNDFRIRQSLSTLKLLSQAGAQVTAISHLSDNQASLAPVRELLKTLAPGVRLLENLRQNPAEEMNDIEFAKMLTNGQDLFVNDAFSACHRKHASIVGIPPLLPSYAGLLLEREIKELSRAFEPEHPFIFVLGGIKFSTKIPLINKFLDLADKIFIGGALAASFFKALGQEIGESTVDKDLDLLKPFLNQPKIGLPKKMVWVDNKIVDVDPESFTDLAPDIVAAKMILWNGPMGNFEAGYSAGTKTLIEQISGSNAYSIVGGGDTVAAIEEMNLGAKFGFISTGGGAMLDFLGNGTLPGIEALKDSSLSFPH